jgi:hypothetical protein
MTIAHLEFFTVAREYTDNGKLSWKDVDFVKIRTPGNSTHIPEFEVDKDLLDRWRNSDKETTRNRVKAYESWKACSSDEYIEGTPLKNWPQISPAQLKICQNNKILSIEALAQVPDSHLHVLSYEGRKLRDKAKSYVEAAASTSLVAEEMQKMRVENQRLVERLDALEQKNSELKTLLDSEKQRNHKK